MVPSQEHPSMTLPRAAASHPFSAIPARRLVQTQTGPRMRKRRYMKPAQAAVHAEDLPKQNLLLFSTVEALFKFPPFWENAREQARKKIAKRGVEIGVDLGKEVAALRDNHDWNSELSSSLDASVRYPDYYTRPFHAYDEGNLGWKPAFEVSPSSKSVHCTVMDPESRVIDAEGDAKLRRSFSEKMQELMHKAASRPVEDIVDLACSTGLSSVELQQAFPRASITGVDLSPYFISVAKVMQRQRQAEKGWSGKHIAFEHAAAEDTGLPSESADLVTACLLLHELPQQATKAVLTEAYRLLRPEGTLAIMEMNPASPNFRKIFGNPFAYAAFKSTEPHLMEYITLDLESLVGATGFKLVGQLDSTPKHFTLVATK